MSVDTSIKTALDIASHRLAEYVENPGLEAELLLAHSLDRERSYLRAWPGRMLSREEQDNFEILVIRRLKGEPIAYITGKREFWSLSLRVGPGVLIPRADTELLVERALDHLPKDRKARVADLGTGSGAIALALANERPLAQIIATDRSPHALAIAQANAHHLGLRQIEFRVGDWLHALPDVNFDMIVSNPPYVADSDPHLLKGDLPAEPPEALSAGPDGLDAIRCIVADAPHRLRPGGWLLLEHGYNQGSAVRTLLNNYGYTGIKTTRDLEGHERVTEASRPADGQTSQPA